MNLYDYWNYLHDHRGEVVKLLKTDRFHVDKKFRLTRYCLQLGQEIKRVGKLVSVEIELIEYDEKDKQPHHLRGSNQEPVSYTIGDYKRARQRAAQGDADCCAQMF